MGLSSSKLWSSALQALTLPFYVVIIITIGRVVWHTQCLGDTPDFVVRSCPGSTCETLECCRLNLSWFHARQSRASLDFLSNPEYYFWEVCKYFSLFPFFMLLHARDSGMAAVLICLAAVFSHTGSGTLEITHFVTIPGVSGSLGGSVRGQPCLPYDTTASLYPLKLVLTKICDPVVFPVFTGIFQLIVMI